jgi:putative transposase
MKIWKYGRHTVYTYDGTWYHEACNIIGLKHYLHSPLEKSLMERINQQYFKDRIESGDDYYICIQNETMNITYFMYKIEYNSVSIYNYIYL